jgi:hypothetical protein
MLRSCLLLLSIFALPAQAMPADEAWYFPEDELEAQVAAVSEGELSLLNVPPDKPVHHHHNRIQITHESLKDGWVLLEQCHRQLDPVAETQIVYHAERIRNLQLLSSENITRAWVEGPTIQLSGIGQQASLCLRAESRALSSRPSQQYRLKNGPYMRRFLDGYYPMHVTLEIRYPSDSIELVALHPMPGKAGKLEQRPGYVLWDGWFKGQLFTAFDFRPISQP